MDIKYAVCVLEAIGGGLKLSDKVDKESACVMAIKALEKQIPKVPTYEGDGYADGQLVYDTWICPNCGKSYEVDYDDYNYCPNCGQHIDTSKLNFNGGTRC